MARGGRNRQRRNNKKLEASETCLVDSESRVDANSGDYTHQDTTPTEIPDGQNEQNLQNDQNDHDTYETQTFGFLSDKPAHPFGPSFEELPIESIDYFKEIEKKLDIGFDSPDDLEIFLENVFPEVLDKEVQVSVHPEVAVVMEKLLKWGNEFQLRIFWDRLSGNYLNLFRHVFGSHVCQTLLTLAADVVEKEVRGESSVQNGSTDGQENGDEGVLLPMQDLIVNMCKELSSHYLTLLHDRYATYLIRVLLSLLSGTPIVIDNVKSKKSKKWGQERNHYSSSTSTSNGPSNSRFKKPQKKLVPKVFNECLNMILEEINSGLMLTGGRKSQDGSGESGESQGKSDVVIRSLAFSKIVNPVLQQLLELPQSEENRLSLVKRFLMMPESEGEEESPAELKARTNYVNGLLKDTVGSHLLEKILKYADQTTLSYLYTHHFKTKLMSLSFHQIANYIVQSFLNSIKDPEMLKEVVEEMKNGFEGLLFNGKPAIVAKLFDACVRLNCCHEEVLNALFNVLGLDTEEKQEKGSWFCILYMISYEDLEASVPTRQRFPHPLGAQILQSILSFPSVHHHSVVLNLLNLDISTWVHHLTHSAGSLTFEYFLKSKTVEYDLKKTIIENIVHYQTPSPQQEAPLLVTLSLDKFGCHVLDHIYSYSDIELKYSICKVLLNHEKKILGSNNMYGKIIWRNLKMEVFKKKVQVNGTSDFKSGNLRVQEKETKNDGNQSQVKQVELVEKEWVKSQEKLIQQKKEWVDMFSEFGVDLGLNGVNGTKVSSKEQDKSKTSKKEKKEKKEKKDKKEKKEKKRKLSDTVEGDVTVDDGKKKKKKSKKE